MSIVKEEAKKLINRLPKDATWDDLLYEFYVKRKIEIALDAVNGKKIISHDEAKKITVKMKIIWSEPAISDLENIRDYIAKDSGY